VRDFTTEDLARLQDVQESAMQDTCVVDVHSEDGVDTWGNPVKQYTAGSAVMCGVEQVRPDEVQASGEVPVIDVVIRLPLGTIVNSADRVTVTHRYGVAQDTAMVYELVGPVRWGPSGVRVGGVLRMDA